MCWRLCPIFTVCHLVTSFLYPSFALKHSNSRSTFERDSGFDYATLIWRHILNPYIPFGIFRRNKMKFITAIIFFLWSLPLAAQSLWEAQQYGAIGTLTSLSILNSNTAFASGYHSGGTMIGGLLIKTINGGQTWETKIYDRPGILGHRVCVFSERNLVVMNEGGSFYRSSDLGENWIQTAKMPLTPSGGRIPEIIFTDSLTYWLFIYDDSAPNPDVRHFVTTDAGRNWKEIDLSRVGDRPNYFVYDKNNFWIGYGTLLKRTTNGGASWTDLNTDLGGPMFFISPLVGWKSGSNFSGRTTLAKTTDGGLTWDSLPRPHPVLVNTFAGGLWFHDEMNGIIASGRGYIFVTSNGGVSWDSVYKASTEFTQVCFADRRVGWAVGTKGVILKTTSGGISWVEEERKPVSIMLSQNYPNPFSTTTTVPVQVKKNVQRNSHDHELTLSLYDLLGRKVKSIFTGALSPGEHEIAFDASNLQSGIYFVKALGLDDAQFIKVCVKK